MEPIRKRTHTQPSGNMRPQLCQLAEPPWTDPGVKSGISVRELISTKKKKREKKHRLRMNGRTFSPNPCKRAKKPPVRRKPQCIAYSWHRLGRGEGVINKQMDTSEENSLNKQSGVECMDSWGRSGENQSRSLIEGVSVVDARRTQMKSQL